MNKAKKVPYKKQLNRNPVKDNAKMVIMRNTVPLVPPLGASEDLFSETPSSSKYLQPQKKTTFSVPDIDESMKSLSISHTSKQFSKNLNDEESRRCLSNTSSKLDVPEAHSSLMIGKRIDRIGKMKTSSVKSFAERKSFDDKVTRQVNFPYEKKIFRDLMPLSSPSKPTPTVTLSREPLPPKDKEPQLEDFMETKEIEEYSYIPNVKLENRRSRAHCNNLRLYKILQLLEQC
ncbi:hypothetical protein HHI36_015266 [Cryptolaemus montrouzieri]|uniref:Protein phosphatase 1 regulatory subunit 35 C-terminal domain-containing protein n=1 Tax=Cryptolaemus montrouzieri TaxID=559131 RepID=A0ABD2N527_9CUCU